MRYIFSPPGEAALRRQIGRRTLLAFDFDGTLAPIVAQPDHAGTPSAVRNAMRRLCALAPVAIITGRAVSDIRERLGFSPAFLVGNHGTEGLPGQIESDLPHPVVAAWEAQFLALAERLPAGTHIENKGRSLSLHYRMAENREFARRELEALVRDLQPLPNSFGGKCVINLLPPNAADKFDALLALARETDAANAFFVGDDVTDEAIFEKALPGWITVRVGYSTVSAADYCINSQMEIIALILRLESLLQAVPARKRQC